MKKNGLIGTREKTSFQKLDNKENRFFGHPAEFS